MFESISPKILFLIKNFKSKFSFLDSKALMLVNKTNRIMPKNSIIIELLKALNQQNKALNLIVAQVITRYIYRVYIE